MRSTTTGKFDSYEEDRPGSKYLRAAENTRNSMLDLRCAEFVNIKICSIKDTEGIVRENGVHIGTTKLRLLLVLKRKDTTIRFALLLCCGRQRRSE